MKKHTIKLIAFVFAVCCLLFYVPVCAATVSTAADAEISFAAAAGKSGDEVTVDVSISGNPGIAYLKLKIDYDTDLSVVKAESKGTLSGTFTTSKTTSVKPYVLQWMGAEDSSGNGVIATLTFKIADRAAVGEKTITVTVDECYNEDFEDVAVAASNAAVTVSSDACTHQNIEIRKAQPATCTENGNNAYYYCADCGLYFADAEGTVETTVAAQTIAALGHDLTMTPAKAATATASGNNAYYTCSRCDKVFKADGVTETTIEAETIPALGDVNISALTYEISDGKVTITDCKTSARGALIIPAQIEGYPVTSIGYWAFEDCSELTSITIPSSVTYIRDWAFYNCESLTSFTVDAENPAYSSDTQGVLYNKDKTKLICCPARTTLKSITIPSSVTYIEYGAFRSCSGLTSIEIPSSVTSIGGYAFSGCSGLTSIEIPSSVTSIGYSAFSGCSGLTSIEIPSSVTYIGDWAFYGCSGLMSIEIPSSVTSIGNYAFYGCSGLTSITIPSSVRSIGGSAFKDCESLTSIEIPSSVTSIGGSAFRGCSGLTSIEILNPDCDIYDSSYTISDTATIYGYVGSTAETYATKYDRAFVALSQVHTHTPVEIPAVPATCVESGLTAGSRCSVCGEILVAQEVVAATGEHDYVKGALVAPTMEKDAYYTYTCSVCGESYEETVAPTGANITLQEQVQVGAEYKIAIGVPKVPTGTTAHGIIFTQYDYNTGAPTETLVTAATGTRIFYTPGIPAMRMNDSLTARYYRITNGIKYVSNVTLDCSLVDYYNQKVAAGADARLIEALEAMLNYGSAAQIHFDYNIEEIDGDSHSGLVNRHIPQANRKSAAADFASVAATNAMVKAGDTSGKGLTYYQMRAQVEQRINLALAYKRVNKSLDKSTLTFRGTYTDGTGEAQTVTVSGENFVASGSNYYTVYIDTVPAKDLRCMITGAIYDANDVQVSDTITTSLESYVKVVLGSSNDYLKAVCLATLGYSDAMAAYVNK